MPSGFRLRQPAPPRCRPPRTCAGRVRAEAEAALQPGHRRGVDDVAAFAMGTDMRKEGADAVKHAHQVDVEHPSPVVERDVVDAAAAGDTGIVADHMDISERTQYDALAATFRRWLGSATSQRDAAHIGPEIAQAVDGSLPTRPPRYRRAASPSLPAGKGAAERKPDAASPPVTNAVLPGELPHD